MLRRTLLARNTLAYLLPKNIVEFRNDRLKAENLEQQFVHIQKCYKEEKIFLLD